jgi:chromosome partitioning protein
MAIIAMIGRKGGIGKSTITANLAAELLARGRTVIVLDTDPQQSMLAWAGLGKGLLARIVKPIEASRPDRFKKTVADAAEEANRVLIDTPPGFADPALLAALVADLVLLPCGPSPLDLIAVRDALELARDARQQRDGKKPRIRLVPSKVMRTTISRDTIAGLEELKARGERVLPPISHRVAVAEAALTGLTVAEYDPAGLAHQEFQELATAVEEALK